MAAASRRLRALTIPRGRWYVEVIGAVAGFELYDAILARRWGDAEQAVLAGRGIDPAERSLHLAPEHAFNSLASTHASLAIVSGYWYALTHVLITACVLVYLWTRRPNDYARLRTALVTISLLGLLVFWLEPVAPPRFTVRGLTDPLTEHDILGAAHVHKGLVNLYAAMPSLHIAWATWCAISVVVTCPSTRWRHLAWAYPLLMTGDVLTTANHYLFDVLAGAALTVIVMGAYARPRAHVRPGARDTGADLAHGPSVAVEAACPG